ncbi:MAG: mannitol dehydrogenase family protein [Propionicimonas sp.]|nr:mannitol dehydrogenase family protein [Propionicimonas sp.]
MARLSRAVAGRPPAPVRIVHLGLGNFVRAHLAWYTEHSPDAAGWGIAAFTGRSPGAAEALAPQDGLYTLITRAPAGDELEVVSSLSAVHPGGDHDSWLAYWRSPAIAIVSLTVTEGGYLRNPDGGLDLAHPAVAADLAALRADLLAPVHTAPARLVAGMAARRAAGAGPLTVLPCDNLSSGGAVAARVVADLAAAVDPSLPAWVEANVGFATCIVDRITPGTTDADRAAVLAATGLTDAAPVQTEPFSEWVVAGGFPAGRPRWDDAGVRFVADVGPFEQRKLALLNGAHSLLAYAGTTLGHECVVDAIGDPRCRAWVEQWWDEAVRHLPLPAEDLDAYRAALLARFGNPRMRDALARIAADGSAKLPIRIVPTLRSERAQGRVPTGACRVVAAWAVHLRRGTAVSDVRPELVAGLATGSLADTVAGVLGHLGADLAADPAVVEAVLACATELESAA